MALSERDRRVLEEIEHDLEAMNSTSRRWLRFLVHPRTVGAAGLLIGATLVGLGLHLSTGPGVAAASAGFILMLLAAQVLCRWVTRRWLLGRTPRRRRQ